MITNANKIHPTPILTFILYTYKHFVAALTNALLTLSVTLVYFWNTYVFFLNQQIILHIEYIDFSLHFNIMGYFVCRFMTYNPN